VFGFSVVVTPETQTYMSQPPSSVALERHHVPHEADDAHGVVGGRKVSGRDSWHRKRHKITELDLLADPFDDRGDGAPRLLALLQRGRRPAVLAQRPRELGSLVAGMVGDLPEPVTEGMGIGCDDGLVVPIPVPVALLRRMERQAVEFNAQVVALVEVIEEADPVRALALDLVPGGRKPVGALDIASPPALKRELDTVPDVSQG